MDSLTKFWVSILVSFAFAIIVSYLITPLIIKLAYKLGAVDVPRDNRRMHKEPIPRMGGLGIFFAFALSVILFCDIDIEMVGILVGAALLVILGIFDDVLDLKPWVKLIFQFVAALFPVLDGVVVERVSNFFSSEKGAVIEFGVFSIPVTLLWIVGIINAVNWLDGLDGLACGISSISAMCMFVVSLAVADSTSSLILIALTGACFGFLPYNQNPAKIFMGDTGSMFLGYILATMSVQGLFKLYAVISFLVPLLVLALPLFDFLVSINRRLLHGKSPFTADRGHIHHRLIDIGLSQKQAVALLYIVSALLGCIAVIFTTSGKIRLIILLLSIAIGIALSVYIYILYGKKHRHIEVPAEEQEKQTNSDKE